VAEEGWSAEALAAGAQALGLRAASAGAFPRGAVELAWHVMRRANAAMSLAMQADAADEDAAQLPANERLFRGLRARLLHVAPLARSWPQAMALGARPDALPETLRLIAVMADECWFLAGDRSASLHWYSRRAVLAAVFVAAEAHMLTDRSPGLEDTWAFLRRRIEDATALGRAADDAGGALAAAGAGAAAVAEAAAELLHARGGGGGGGGGARGGAGGSGVGEAAEQAEAAASAAAAAAAAATAAAEGGGGASTSSPSRMRAGSASEGVAALAGAAASAAAALDSMARAAGVKLPELDLQAALGALGSLLPAAPADGGAGRVRRGERRDIL